MKKVIFNNCFGGFSISRACAKWLADRGNKECIDVLDDIPHSELKSPYFNGCIYETLRHDALLVMAVETLGSKIASGEGSDLKVHTLVGSKYFIDEYDGSESVVEPHTITWIEV